MIGVLAFIALVISLSAISLCHHNQPWPLRRRTTRGTPNSPPEGSAPAPDPPDPPDTRPTPSWARTEHDHKEAA
ncbi:hypothetical protein FNV62_43540 [Streptomyces sp. RLB3-17]|uniref:hypothetical protein n=1 Tax=unclassified Streptomyces TaxID=2593676 RepID=UPI001164E6AF|nr:MULTISPECIES: hypothetical protein [unclassified Streptomyces]QDO02188.1 hypothetical protein FNV58_45155 [Streptomyces sp. RLB1-9]QDO23922.1 hypothetical protein FNV65_43740 [Streptomyces sp. S1A1-8]QDO34047.1 hypothetical protein FNV63_43765 [Streptomyces sp. S1A1-3]QDO44049.1 hypothetical protein FNV62_43540 [Streptomyces sp. RLB3-17]